MLKVIALRYRDAGLQSHESDSNWVLTLLLWRHLAWPKKRNWVICKRLRIEQPQSNNQSKGGQAEGPCPGIAGWLYTQGYCSPLSHGLFTSLQTVQPQYCNMAAQSVQWKPLAHSLTADLLLTHVTASLFPTYRNIYLRHTHHTISLLHIVPLCSKVYIVISIVKDTSI